MNLNYDHELELKMSILTIDHGANSRVTWSIIMVFVFVFLVPVPRLMQLYWRGYLEDSRSNI